MTFCPICNQKLIDHPGHSADDIIIPALKKLKPNVLLCPLSHQTTVCCLVPKGIQRPTKVVVLMIMSKCLALIIWKFYTMVVNRFSIIYFILIWHFLLSFFLIDPLLLLISTLWNYQLIIQSMSFNHKSYSGNPLWFVKGSTLLLSFQGFPQMKHKWKRSLTALHTFKKSASIPKLLFSFCFSRESVHQLIFVFRPSWILLQPTLQQSSLMPLQAIQPIQSSY